MPDPTSPPALPEFVQSPSDRDFVQSPYSAYDRARAAGDLVWWSDYGMAAAMSHGAVHALLRDSRFGREIPADLREPAPPHLAPFLAIEENSLLEIEPPRHTRLRGHVLRAFTSRAIRGLEPGIAELCRDLADAFPEGRFDLIESYCARIPVIMIARLLGVPEDMSPQLLSWSHAMVAMYQAGRKRETEDLAARAAGEFSGYLRSLIAERKASPRDDLISGLVAATAGSGLADDRRGLTEAELVSTAILLLNAGHEATVHALGNGAKAIMEAGLDPRWLAPDAIEATVEEVLRFDPPLHVFTRYAYERVTAFGHEFGRGDQVALALGAACRDPAIWADPDRFDPSRPQRPHLAFGGGAHFCLGAALARLEMRVALPILFDRHSALRIAVPPRYADTYHFRGLERLEVEIG